MARYEALLAWIQRLPPPLGLLGVLTLVLAFWAALFAVLYVIKLGIGPVAALVLLAIAVTWLVATNRD